LVNYKIINFIVLKWESGAKPEQYPLLYAL